MSGARPPSTRESLESVYNMFREEGTEGVTRSKCKAFLWATGVVDEGKVKETLNNFMEPGSETCVRVYFCVCCV